MNSRPIDTQYEDFMRHVYLNGHKKSDRTGTGTLSVFGYQMRWDLRKGFPLVTTKKVHLRSIIAELVWFLEGSQDNNRLRELGTTIWSEWARPDGSLGPIYGVQWRSWPGRPVSYQEDQIPLDLELGGAYRISGAHDTVIVRKPIDQIAQIIDQLKNNPDSRRILVSAWNVEQLDQMALMPCHVLFQFYSRELSLEERFKEVPPELTVTANGEFTHKHLDAYGIPRRSLSCQLYQRSADIFLGVPFNIASYAMLTHMVAQQTGHAVGDFIWAGGDCHIYDNHHKQVELQLSRDARPFPKLYLQKAKSINDYTVTSATVVGYEPHPHIPAPVAV